MQNIKLITAELIDNNKGQDNNIPDEVLVEKPQRIVTLEDIDRLTNWKKNPDGTLRYHVLMKGSKSPKWYHEKEMPTLPAPMVGELRCRRTLQGKARKNKIKLMKDPE